MSRVFFAVQPAEQFRQPVFDLTSEQTHQSGQRVPLANLHLTLVFLGSIDDTTLDCVRNAAAQVRSDSFELSLSNPGHFPRARVGWIGPDHCPGTLQDLVTGLATVANNCGIAIEARAYTPHVTLLRKAVQVPEWDQPEPIIWPVDQFVLMVSESGSYQVLQSWPLNAV